MLIRIPIRTTTTITYSETITISIRMGAICMGKFFNFIPFLVFAILNENFVRVAFMLLCKCDSEVM